MTTKSAVILSLSIFFLSCSKEADLIQTDSNSNYETRTSIDAYKSTIGVRVDDEPSILITTTHFLRGQGEIQNILEKVKEEAAGAVLPSRRYAIEANGDAMSDAYARGFSELNLVYHTGAHQLSGVLTTDFFFGEKLELTLDGNVTTRFVGDMVKISVNVKEAVFRTKTAVYKLSSGEVKFLLPKNPEGELTIAISSTVAMDKI